MRARPKPEPSQPRYAFSLGVVPVQEWIAEARRSRDLRAGSAVLSWLMGRLLGWLDAEVHADVRIPGQGQIPGPGQDLPGATQSARQGIVEAMRSPYGRPNRLSGFCGEPTGRRVDEAFAELQGVVEGAWTEFQEAFLVAPELKADGRKFWENLKPHLEAYRKRVGPAGDCPFQVIWVVQELGSSPEDPEEAAGALESIDRLYAEAKRSRFVRPWPAPDEIGKCTLCGNREASGPTEEFHRWREWHRANDEDPWVKRGWRLDAGERLCYVCLAKRMAAYADKEGEFPSTGWVASSPWRKAIGKAGGELSKSLQELLSLAGSRDPSEPADPGRMLYCGDEDFKTWGIPEGVARRNALREAIQRHNRQAENGPTPTRIPPDPPRYLALLAFDGDDMGRAVRKDQHAAAHSPGQGPEPPLSARLQAFAETAYQTLTQQERAVFYLAGDEGVALLPAAKALAVAQTVQETFTQTLGPAFTLSAGLVYFEQSLPMGRALREALRLQHAAKGLRGKNALGVAVETAAGTRWELVDRWGTTWERVSAAVEAVRDDRLAAGWAYDVEAFLSSLDEGTWRQLANNPEPVRKEVERLLRRRVPPVRSRGERGGRDRSDRRARAQALWTELRGAQLWTSVDDEPAPKCPEQFHLIGFLARQLGTEPQGITDTEESAA